MKSLILFLFISLLIISVSCDSTTEPIKEKLLKGTVKDTQGNLLSDVKVFIIYDCGQSLPKTQNYFNVDELTGINFVELTSFAALVFENNVKVSWSTATELENLGFEIQRKVNTSNEFNTIGFVEGSGTTTEPKNYSFTDYSVGSGSFDYRLKAIAFDSTFEYSNTINVEFVTPFQSGLAQNYPNPFDLSTTIRFQLRKQANVKMDVCSFYDNSTLNNLIDQQLNAGSYSLIFQPDSLPNNAYKILLGIQEPDSTYTIEKNIFKTYLFYDQAILNSCLNSITNSGSFEIKYDDIPFGQKFYRTGEADPSPLGELTLKNNLKLVIYKPGYKVVQKDVTLDLNEGQEINITLELE